MNKVNRLKDIPDVVDRRLTTHIAAERLGIYDRNCRRLLQQYRADGPLGMPDRRRGKPSKYQLHDGLPERAVQIIRGVTLILARRWPARSWPSCTA